MKKAILVFGMLVAGFGSKAQTIQVEQQTTLWEAKYSYVELIDDRKSNNPWSFYLPFQNAEYSRITDIGSLTFSDVNTLKTFVNTCKQMLEHKSQNLKVDGKGYRLNRYDFSPEVIYVTDTKSYSSKYFTLNVNDISEIEIIVSKL